MVSSSSFLKSSPMHKIQTNLYLLDRLRGELDVNMRFLRSSALGERPPIEDGRDHLTLLEAVNKKLLQLDPIRVPACGDRSAFELASDGTLDYPTFRRMLQTYERMSLRNWLLQNTVDASAAIGSLVARVKSFERMQPLSYLTFAEVKQFVECLKQDSLSQVFIIDMMTKQVFSLLTFANALVPARASAGEHSHLLHLEDLFSSHIDAETLCRRNLMLRALRRLLDVESLFTFNDSNAQMTLETAVFSGYVDLETLRATQQTNGSCVSASIVDPDDWCRLAADSDGANESTLKQLLSGLKQCTLRAYAERGELDLESGHVRCGANGNEVMNMQSAEQLGLFSPDAVWLSPTAAMCAALERSSNAPPKLRAGTGKGTGCEQSRVVSLAQLARAGLLNLKTGQLVDPAPARSNRPCSFREAIAGGLLRPVVEQFLRSPGRKTVAELLAEETTPGSLSVKLPLPASTGGFTRVCLSEAVERSLLSRFNYVRSERSGDLLYDDDPLVVSLVLEVH